MTLTEKALEVFCADRFATQLVGIELVEVGDHTASCILKVTPPLCNARGVAMGGAVYTLADFAAAVAANTDCLDSKQLRWVSLGTSIHYLSPARCETTLRADCIPVKVGHSTALYQVHISDRASGKLVASAEATMMRLSAD